MARGHQGRTVEGQKKLINLALKVVNNLLKMVGIQSQAWGEERKKDQKW